MRIITNPSGHKYVGVIDSSAWQFKYDSPDALRPGAKKPNLQKAVDRGIAGIVHRIGNGRNADPSWDMMCTDAKRVGMPLSGYYYFQPNQLSARKAADYVLWWIGSDHELGLPMMLDCENYSGPRLSPGAVAQWKEDWFDYIQAETGVRPILYTGAWWWNPNVGNAGDFSDIDAIISRYARGDAQPPSDLDQWASWIPWDKYPAEPRGIGTYEGWQFTSSGKAVDFGFPTDGIPTLDLNLISLDTFNEWRAPFTGNKPTEPPVTPPPVIVTPGTNETTYTAEVQAWTRQEQIMDLSYNLVKQKRLVDQAKNTMDNGDQIVIPPQAGLDSPKALHLGVVVVDDNGKGGHLRSKDMDGNWPDVSVANADLGSVAANQIVAPVQADGSVQLRWYGPGPAKVAVDIFGYYKQIGGGNVTTSEVEVVTGVTTKKVKVVK